MSRWASALNEAAAERDNIKGCFLLDLEFDSGHVRVNDSGAEVVFGGNTYFNTGQFGTFDEINESEEFVARGLRVTLSGVDSSIISTIKSEVYKNRPARLYCGLFAENSTAFVADPELQWSGLMDVMKIEGTKHGSDIVTSLVLQCEHRLRASPPNSRWADADQKARSFDDRFFNMLTMVSSYVGPWGERNTTYGPKPGGGYGPG